MANDASLPALSSDTRLILFVHDFDVALGFYRDVLGLELAYPAGGGWAEFGTGGVSLCLHDGRRLEGTTRKVAVFGWRVDDLDATVARLREQGVAVNDPTPVTAGIRAAEFDDPSGNALFVEGA